MSSLSSLSRAVSGLMANQTALNTTAHNLSNVNTPGYVRQQVLMKDSSYLTIGRSSTSLMQSGLGTDVQSIRQVRGEFLDLAYRTENSRYGFYSAQATSIDEIENIIGETEGEAFSKILNDLWTSISELSKHPEGLETRGSFVQNAALFVEKANLIGTQLREYQENLNGDIASKVERINEIGVEIEGLNNIIASEEANGGNANDYRDQRNLLLDELSYMVDVNYREDHLGNLLINVENVPFVTIGNVNQLGTVQAEDFSNLVDPYWPHLSSAGPPPVNRKLYNLANPTGAQYDNNKGELKGMIISRGSRTANYTDLDPAIYESEIKPSTIMTVQAQFDQLVHGVVTAINDLVSPNTVGPPKTLAADAPYGLKGEQGVEVFSRKYVDRYDGLGNYNEEDPANQYSLYSAGNIQVNPDLLSDYNQLCISSELGIDGDSTVVEAILEKWEAPFSTIEPGTTGVLNFFDFYNTFVSNVGLVGNSSMSQMDNQRSLITQIDNQRSQIMAVSSDEELGNMIKYQHAYNASTRVITVLDQMIERVIDQTGLVGR